MKIRDQGTSYVMEVPLREILEERRSTYQHIIIADANNFGKILVLDAEIQFSEADEHVYHESLAYPPALLSEGNDFLILGGGDGLLANTLKKFTEPENISVVDLDQEVVDVSKKHFWNLGASSLEEVNLHIGDALKFEAPSKYDVVFVDLVDFETAPHLYDLNALKKYASFMKDDGILVFHSDYIYSESIVGRFKPHFKSSMSYAAYVPSFLSLWSFHMFSNREFVLDRLENASGRYFNRDSFWEFSPGRVPVIDRAEEVFLTE